VSGDEKLMLEEAGGRLQVRRNVLTGEKRDMTPPFTDTRTPRAAGNYRADIVNLVRFDNCTAPSDRSLQKRQGS